MIFSRRAIPVEVQRRRSLRFPCRAAAHCVVGDRQAKVHIVDVSEGGARLRIERAVTRGAELLLRCGHQSITVPVRVQWVRRRAFGYEAGAVFTVPLDTGSWMAEALRLAARGRVLFDTRVDRRYRVAAPVGLRVEDVSLPGRLVDVSVGGALFRGDVLVEVGAPVLLKMGAAALPGHVARWDGESIAIRFDPLSPAQQVELRAVLESITAS